jgi:hypothetical protein
MKYLIVLFLCFVFVSALANDDKALDPFVEIDKTNRFIEFEASFDDCPVKANFKAQDGAMVTFSVEGSPTIKFIVKKYSESDIKLHLVKESEFTIGGKKRKALAIQPGLDLLKSVSVDALRAQGVKSLTYKTDYPFDPASVARTAPPKAGDAAIQQQARNCCCFTACGNKRACVCGSGPVCAFDGCGGCCTGGDPNL